jgi:hypothetical protein
MISPVRTDPFIFRWAVSGAGYEWLPGRDNKDIHLVPCDEPGVGVYVKEPPSGLFLEFAALKPSQKPIAAFADEHGDLFETFSGFGDMVIRDNRTVAVGTSLTDWKRAIEDMRQLVTLWGHIKQRHLAELKKIITRDDKGISYTVGGRYVLLAHAEIVLDVPFRRFAPKDVLLPAKYALQKELNRRLSDPVTFCVPQLAWTPDTPANHQRIIFRPNNLLAAMWLRLAQAVTEEFQLRVCEGCGKYFQVGPGGRRADAKTCGDACRQRKNRP